MPRNLKLNEKSTNDEAYEEEAEEIVEDAFEGISKSLKAGRWIEGGQQRDRLIQKMLKYANEFGMHYSSVKEETIESSFVRGHQCMTFLKKYTELLLNNDDRITRELLIQTSKYKILPQKLVPLLEESIDDRKLATKCIILCNTLTYSLDIEAIKALNVPIKSQTSKETKVEAEQRINKELLAKENANEQIIALLSFKESLVKEEVIEAILAYAQDAIIKSASTRTDKENKIIERVLVLISNLLAIDSCCLSSPAQHALAKSLHLKLVLLLQGEFFDSLLFLSQAVREEQNAAWVVLFIEIIANLIRGRESRDMFKAWKLRLQGKERTLPSGATRHSSTSNTNNPLTSRSNISTAGASSSLSSSLLNQVNRERQSRLNLSQSLNGARHSRFSGVYQLPPKKPLLLDPDLSTGTTAAPTTTTAAANGMIVRTVPVASSGGGLSVIHNLPQAPKKRDKRNITCIKDDAPVRPLHGTESTLDVEVDQCVSLFLDRLLEGAFSELTHGVKEDFRRGDGLINFRDEINYFRLTSVCLSYHRMKILEQYKTRDLATDGNRNRTKSSNSSSGSGSKSKTDNSHSSNETSELSSASLNDAWVPDIKNILQCLDRMSFRRAVAALQRLQEKGGQSFDLDLLVVPMEVYKELVCYLHVLLQSSEQSHQDIALASLYKIFYITQEREDPLPALLRDWKPGLFGRRHLSILIELFHETMKTLETAQKIFCNNKELAAKKLKGKNKDKALPSDYDEHLELYLLAAIRFDSKEYFRRLISNQTIRMYSRVLQMYDSNAPWVNHYVYTFFQRLCNFKLEGYENSNNNTITSTTNTGENDNGVTLGYLLFNIQTLLAFSDILNNPKICDMRDATSTSLIRLIKMITRKFVQLTQKNKMLFVEVLLQHPHPQRFILDGLDSVYEANSYTTGQYYGQYSDDYELMERNEFGNSVPSTSNTAPRNTTSDWGDEFDDESAFLMTSSKGTTGDAQGRKALTKKKKWTALDDRLLRSYYHRYAGDPKIFERIATAMSEEKGIFRSSTQISKRVASLRLHLTLDHSENEEEAADEESSQDSDQEEGEEEEEGGGDVDHQPMDHSGEEEEASGRVEGEGEGELASSATGHRRASPGRPSKSDEIEEDSPQSIASLFPDKDTESRTKTSSSSSHYAKATPSSVPSQNRLIKTTKAGTITPTATTAATVGASKPFWDLEEEEEEDDATASRWSAVDRLYSRPRGGSPPLPPPSNADAPSRASADATTTPGVDTVNKRRKLSKIRHNQKDSENDDDSDFSDLENLPPAPAVANGAFKPLLQSKMRGIIDDDDDE